MPRLNSSRFYLGSIGDTNSYLKDTPQAIRRTVRLKTGYFSVTNRYGIELVRLLYNLFKL